MTPAQFYLALAVPAVSAIVALLGGILYSNSRFNEINSRFNEINGRFNEMDGRMADMKSDLKDIFRAEMGRLESQMLVKFAELDNRLTRLEAKER